MSGRTPLPDSVDPSSSASLAIVASPRPFEHLRRRANTNPSGVFLRTATATTTNAAALASAVRLGRELRRIGVQPGDIVAIDDAGFVRIVDRIKELIITGGFNVSPSEVEDALKTHPDVVDAAVVGLPSEHSGEEVVAAIVVAPGVDVDVEAIREFARGILTPYKVPRRLFVVDELPRNLIGKVLRRQVREKLIDVTRA